jgi:serine/threonine-protein kinase RsbW
VRGSTEAVHTPGPAIGTERLALDIPPDPEHVRTARLFAAATARHYGIGEEDVEDLKVAVSEAVTNAIRAHADAAVGDPISIVASADGSAVRFDVIDAGAGFDPAERASDSADYTPPGGLIEGTLGLVVISALFPNAAIVSNPDHGMTVSIVIERPAGA